MNSDKDFAAGTATAGTNNQIVIAQKEGTTNYSNANLASHNFVVHGMVVGQTNEWWYGAGATDSALAVTMDEEVGPTGAPSATINGVTLAVAVDGTVTLVDALGARASNFEGFLSVDKKTMVGTYTDINGDYQLMVVQVTDGQAVANMTGSSYNHLLGVGDDILWAHHDINVSRFETSFLPDILELHVCSGCHAFLQPGICRIIWFIHRHSAWRSSVSRNLILLRVVRQPSRILKLMPLFSMDSWPSTARSWSVRKRWI